jgi:hypothetical protein
VFAPDSKQTVIVGSSVIAFVPEEWKVELRELRPLVNESEISAPIPLTMKSIEMLLGREPSSEPGAKRMICTKVN